jgi:hypothetical protein
VFESDAADSDPLADVDSESLPEPDDAVESLVVSDAAG